MDIDEVRDYWKGKNVPQQWYSKKDPLTMLQTIAIGVNK